MKFAGVVLTFVFLVECSLVATFKIAPKDWNPYKGADHHGIRGGFKIHRCTKTKEGDQLYCEYNVHYDKFRRHEPISIDHLRCVKRNHCDSDVGSIDRSQQVTERFIQHCIEITHSLITNDNKITASFIEEYKGHDGIMHKCIMN